MLFDEYCGAQTVGIDIDKYGKTLTFVKAINKRKQLAIRRTIRRQLLSANCWDSCRRVEAISNPPYYSPSIAACKPLIPIDEQKR